ncbi:Fic domain-containing protein [Campylobacter blaseri]|uniref:Fido domain-containing protein n=1 Tax=Campylobacter blaseri TaxID=2042961 RepID=A0A2P8QYJ1_9BACT|nr:Fic family protein [Campylobacter blaseri]PSM51319.1 hypothetical protein CQ405_08810 [Campylobacter blaseri]PSM52463.1 hypothetical protein CRN67_08815 [Campylobacter blaseri]QKF86205.1 Fic domain-containing protein [Campylobacter blaseri]
MSEIVIYEDGQISLNVSLEDESVWLSQKQMADLFHKNVRTINEHIINIFKEGELEKKAVIRNFRITADDGKRYLTNLYNLDVVISVGYRVKSKEGTKFRIWATKVLKDYLLKGYALNQKILNRQKITELNKTLNLIKNSINQANLIQSKGFIEIISKYAKSWALLQGYDTQSLKEMAQTNINNFILDYNEAKKAIDEFKKELIKKGEASNLFGQEKADELKGNILNIYQTFQGLELLPSVEQKAANLLYYIVKGHPFIDGNKRIGAYLFILFLDKNKILYKNDNELKINDNALASLTILIATSKPESKDIIIKLILNILYDGESDDKI